MGGNRGRQGKWLVKSVKKGLREQKSINPWCTDEMRNAQTDESAAY